MNRDSAEVTRQLASNIRYNFIHHPLSNVFLVCNDLHYVDLERPTAAQVPSEDPRPEGRPPFSF